MPTFCLGILLRWVVPIPAPILADNAGINQYFGQDDIRVNSKLTVNVGLRYEYSPWLNGYKGQLGTFDPTQAKPIIVEGNTSQVDLTSQFAAPAAYQFFGQYIQTSSQAGLPYSITYTDRTQFGPRVGFAWQPFGNDTVVRGGFGIFYEPEGTSGRVNRNILPFLLSETVNQTTECSPQSYNRELLSRLAAWFCACEPVDPANTYSPEDWEERALQLWSAAAAFT